MKSARPLGIVTHSDLRDRDQYTQASLLMSPRLISFPVGIANRDAFLQMDEARVKAAPVLDEAGRLAGVITRNDAVRLELLRPALGASGELMVAAAVGISAQALRSRGSCWTSASPRSCSTPPMAIQRRMLETIAAVKAVVRGRVPIIAATCAPLPGPTRSSMQVPMS